MKIKKFLKIISIAIKYLLLIILSISLFCSIYINHTFNNISFEQLLFSIKYSEGTSVDAISGGIVYISIRVAILLFCVLFLKYLYHKLKIFIYLKIITRKKNIRINIIKWYKVIFFIAYIILVPILSIKLLNIDDYIKMQKSASRIFEDYYVAPQDIDFSFPEKKRNLIYIFVESLESSNISKENGGLVEKSYIPNLERLALENINFSNNERIGGAYPIVGTAWTAGAMVAHTSGIPLKISIAVNGYSGFGEFLPGVYSIGEILKNNGYENYLMIGSDASFGGRRDYFTYHGDYKIYDYLYAKEKGWIDENYNVWWGYEDKKLFEFAKENLLEISKKDEPFNFTMLTADTHFVDGYLDESCESVFESHYANSFYCSDQMLNEFIEWIMRQDFYENTTIIVVGDHLTMQSGFYNEEDEKNRTIYNVFINSVNKPVKGKNRIFTTLDLFPTTLSSLGVTFKGNRLGMGVNLFSSEETLPEKMEYDYFQGELSKKSYFYDNELLRDSYYEMQKIINK